MITENLILDTTNQQSLLKHKQRKSKTKSYIVEEYVAQKVIKDVHAQQQQQKLQELEAQLEQEQSLIQTLKSDLKPQSQLIDIIDKISSKLDSFQVQVADLKQNLNLLPLQNKLLLDLAAPSQNKNEKKMFDITRVLKLFTLPHKSFRIAELMEQFDSEYEYIQSLQLEQVQMKTANSLEYATKKIQNAMKSEKKDLYFNYEVIQDATQSQEYLKAFNCQFSSFINQIIMSAEYLKQKEETYLTQLESLQSQNSILFEENCELSRQIRQYKVSGKEPIGIKRQGLEEGQYSMIEELTGLFSSKIEMLKEQINNQQILTSSEASPTKKLQKLSQVPLEDPKVFQVINQGLNSLYALSSICEQKFEQIQKEEHTLKHKLKSLTEKLTNQQLLIDQIIMKYIPKCQILLNFNEEYLKKTLSTNKNLIEDTLNEIEANQKYKITVLNLVKCHQQLSEKLKDIYQTFTE